MSRDRWDEIVECFFYDLDEALTGNCRWTLNNLAVTYGRWFTTADIWWLAKDVLQ